MNGSLMLEVLDPLLALAQRNSRTLAMLHVAVEPADIAGADAAQAIRDASRNGDLVAQLSGGRFAVALVEVWDAEAAARVAHRIVRSIGSLDASPEARVGVAFYPGDARDSASLLADAVRATPAEKPIGFTDPEMGRDTLTRVGLMRALAGQCTTSQFRLHYQPIRSIRGGQVVGAEALARWDRDGALLPAADFIGLARSTGRIRSIELWTMRRAFREVRRWRDEGWDGWMSVNISGRSLADPRLPEIVAGILESSGTPAESILFEVTERSALAGNAACIGTLEALRGLGARIAVDDFGAGYASFEYLCDFDPDLVKLDRAFTARTRGPGGADLLEILVDVAHRLDKPVVVEGVENRNEWERVAATPSEYVQGYFTGRPVPGPTFVRQHLATRHQPMGDPAPAVHAA